MLLQWIAAFCLLSTIQGFRINHDAMNMLKDEANSDIFDLDQFGSHVFDRDSHYLSKRDKGYDLNAETPRQTEEGLTQKDETAGLTRSDAKAFYLNGLRSYLDERETPQLEGTLEDSDESKAKGTDLDVNTRDIGERSSITVLDLLTDVGGKLDDMQEQIELRGGKKLDVCPDGWHKYGKSCYFFSRVNANWLDAVTFCRSFHSYLAEVDDYSENEYLKQKARVLGPFWLGGTDHIKENHWMWLTSETPMTTATFSDWISGEPNNQDVEHCLQLYSVGWNDQVCHHSQQFVCERDLK